MSTSGGNVTGLVVPPVGRNIALGRSSAGSAGWTNGGAFLAAVQVPGPITLLQLGVQVTGAGDAGSTVVPLLYADTGNGEPGALLLAGTAVPGDAVGVNKAPCNITLQPGWVWAGALILGAPVTKPTLYAVQSSAGLSPNGEICVVAAAQAVQSCWFQGGLAAAPNPFAGTPASVVAPLVTANT